MPTGTADEAKLCYFHRYGFHQHERSDTPRCTTTAATVATKEDNPMPVSPNAARSSLPAAAPSPLVTAAEEDALYRTRADPRD